MSCCGCACFAAILLAFAAAAIGAQQPIDPPLPDIRQLMIEVQQHQRQLDKVREDYTYTSLETTQDIDAAGQVKKTETVEQDNFFVNGHLIQRMVGKDGRPLAGHDLDKENERVTKLVEKAEKTPPGERLEGPTVTVSRLLDIMDVRNPRREMFRGRPTIVFDFVGRKDVKTHGLAEDASKKLEGTVWIDEADCQVAQLEASFDDNFRLAGGLLATVQKGSSFRFDQAPVPHMASDPAEATNRAKSMSPPARTPISAELWLPTGAEGAMQARLLLLKGIRQRYTERDYGFKRFSVATRQSQGVQVAPQSP